ncbi:MAG: hypothetical protein WDW36_008394 [Sanguina aurantia]
MGLEPSPELLAIAMVYFVQGILGLSRLALFFFFKDELQVQPAEVAMLTGLSGLPWIIKPLYGFLSDSVPLFGYRRRSYLVLCGIAGALAWTGLATFVASPSQAVCMMLVASLSTAMADVVVDSIVVERARGEPQSVAGSLQSLCWTSHAVGSIASSYFSGSLVQDYGVRTVFGLTAMFPLVVSGAALLINEKPVSRNWMLLPSHEEGDGSLVATPQPPLLARLTSQATSLKSAISRKDILLPAVFVFLWQATPSSDTAMQFFFTNQLHFNAEFLGRVKFVGAVAKLAGIYLYNAHLKRVPIKKMLSWAMGLGVVLGSTQLILISGLNRTWGLSDQLFVLGDSVVLTVLGELSFMPILVLAARLCPEGVEATLFATLMSLLNAGGFAGSFFGAGLTSAYGVTATNFDSLLPLVLTCTLCTAIPAVFLRLLPDEADASGDGSDGGGGGGGGVNSVQEQDTDGGVGASSGAGAGEREGVGDGGGGWAGGGNSGEGVIDVELDVRGKGGMQVGAEGSWGG